MNYVLIALIWTGYCVIHSYLISIRFTHRMNSILGRYYAFYRLFYVVLSIVLLYPVFRYTGKMASEVIITYHAPWSVIRYILIYGSIFIGVKAFFVDYDSLSFIGIRQILNFGKKKETRPRVIKKSGLLGIIRHPMYFAVIIYLWCQTFRISDIVVNSVLTIYIFIGTILEERKLVLEFGGLYTQYQKEVPMLIPFVRIK